MKTSHPKSTKYKELEAGTVVYITTIAEVESLLRGQLELNDHWITLCNLKNNLMYVEKVEPEIIDMELPEVEKLLYKVMADNPPTGEEVEKFLVEIQRAALATFPKQTLKREFPEATTNHVKPLIEEYFNRYWEALKEGEHLLDYVKKGQREEVEKALAAFKFASLKKAIVNFVSPTGSGETALSIAAPDGNLEIIRLLVANGADLNHVDNNGASAVHYTAQAGTLASLKLLHELKADMLLAVEVPSAVPEGESAWGWDQKSALQIAEDKQREDCVEFLKGVVNASLKQEEEVQAKLEEEEKEELADVAAADAVNEESKAALADKLAGKMQKQKMDNMDEAEEQQELAAVAAADNVNEESKAALADALADKMQKQKMDNMDEAEEKAELAEIAAADPVNDESLVAAEIQVGEVLEKKKEQAEAAAKEEEVQEKAAEAEPAAEAEQQKEEPAAAAEPEAAEEAPKAEPAEAEAAPEEEAKEEEPKAQA